MLGVVAVDPLGAVPDGGEADLERTLTARLPAAAAASVQALDERLLTGDGSPGDAIEMLRLCFPACAPSSYAAAFTDDGELHFEGIRVGPFVGRDSIAAAYRERPPDDQVELGGLEERDSGTIVARYAWLADDGREAGEMRLTPRDGRIAKLVVTLD